MDLDFDRMRMEGTTRRRMMLGGAGAMAVAGAMIPLTETGTAAAASADIIEPSGDRTGVADTRAINNALQSASRTAVLGAGDFHITPIVLPEGTTLRGQGIGPTRVHARTGSGIAAGSYLLQNAAGSLFITISDLRLIGYGTTNEVHGIELRGFEGSIGMGEWRDSKCRLLNLYLEGFTGDAYSLIGSGANVCIGCQAFNCRGFGWIIGKDNFVAGCESGACGKDGFRIISNPHIVHCKSWFSGFYSRQVQTANVNAGMGNGFVLASNSHHGALLDCCYAQDNARAGFYCERGSGRAVFSGFVTDSNNNRPNGDSHNIEIDTGSNITFTGGLNMDHGLGRSRPASGARVFGGGSGNILEYTIGGFGGAGQPPTVADDTATNRNIYRIGQMAGGSQNHSFAPIITPDPTRGNVIAVGTLTGNIEINRPTVNVNSGSPLTFLLRQDATGNRAVRWASAYFTGGQVLHNLAANSLSAVSFVYDGNARLWRPMATTV